MRARAALAAVLLVGTLIGAGGCGGKPSPQPVAQRFLDAVSRGDYAQADRLAGVGAGTTGKAYRAFLSALSARQVGYRLGRVTTDQSGDAADAAFSATVRPGGYGVLRYQGHLKLRTVDGSWRVVWSPTVVHPALTAGRRITLTRQFGPRAPIVGAGGRVLVRDRPVVTVGVHPRLLRNRSAELARLAGLVGVDVAGLRRSVAAARADDFVPVITLRRPDFERLKPALDRLPGVPYLAGTAPLAPTSTFARPLLGRVGEADPAMLRRLGPPYRSGDRVGLYGLQAAFERRLAGTPTARVVVVNAKGTALQTLSTFQGRPGRPVRITLDPSVQAAAEQALGDPADPDRHAALVALRAGSGDVLAVANRPGDSSFDAALVGRYPPGSTFKVVTTTALLSAGLQPTDPVPCPPSITVGGKRFSNFQGESAPGDVPFRTDFALSCNTAFVRLSSRLSSPDLVDAASRYGIGSTWRLPVPVFTGSVPAGGDAVERAADAIGQGKVLVSPLAMAAVAATVASGRWQAPRLVTDPASPPAERPAARALPAEVALPLRQLMRAVVTDGTARQAFAGLGGPPVYGKTGTAEFGTDDPPRTHAWFIGYRGDLAFAVIVEGGGVGGAVAAPIAARFLRALDGS